MARLMVLGILLLLASPAVAQTDTDGDGISDSVEDHNQNGVWDSGETDFNDADTDDDGVPDGVEDANHNGIFDAGERHPLIFGRGDGSYDILGGSCGRIVDGPLPSSSLWLLALGMALLLRRLRIQKT